MNIPWKFIRSTSESRTLENLQQHHKLFNEEYNGNPKSAKQCFNVIDEVHFDVPIAQVCLPGLHITLGVYLKLFNMLEEQCHQYDINIASLFAAQNNYYDSEFGDHIAALIKARDTANKIQSLEQQLQEVIEEMNWFIITNGREDIVEHHYQVEVTNLEQQINLLKEQEKKISKNLDRGVGPCVDSLDKTLQRLGVERQAYHGKSFIGNHCHKMLRPDNIKILCDSIPTVVETEIKNEALLQEVHDMCGKFEKLFLFYGRCHDIFNASTCLSDEQINTLEHDINLFMMFLRVNWPHTNISPKLHMLEDHVVNFLHQWHVGFGFYGEQGGESIHHEFKRMKHRYSGIKNDLERLRYLMDQHLLTIHPKAKELKPEIKRRKLHKNI